MKNLYIYIILVITFSVSAEEASKRCESEILSADPYGKGVDISPPDKAISNDGEVIFDWEAQVVTTGSGSRARATVRCVYSKIHKQVIFLSIYTDNLISPHKAELERLQSATKEEASAIAIGLGLSDEEIEWLKRNGRRSFYGTYNENGSIQGSAIHSKENLRKLDEMHIINLYEDKHIDNQYLSISTKLSAALSKKL